MLSRNRKKLLCAVFIAGVVEAASKIILEHDLVGIDPLNWRGLLDENKQAFNWYAAEHAYGLVVCIPL